MTMRSLPVLSERAAMTSSRLVKCKGCTACCEQGGLVYVRPDEVSQLKRLQVPLVLIEGVYFIKRLPDGSCPMLDKGQRQCSIYEDRPLCCRLFPLDVLAVDGQLNWALSTQCPEDRKLFSPVQSAQSAIGFGSISLMASLLDSDLSTDDVTYFATKELVSARLEVLEGEHNKWTAIAKCTNEVAPGMLLAKRKETAKEKLARMLKKQQERKRKALEKRKNQTNQKSRKK